MPPLRQQGLYLHFPRHMVTWQHSEEGLHSPFTGGETEAQICEVTYLRSNPGAEEEPQSLPVGFQSSSSLHAPIQLANHPLSRGKPQYGVSNLQFTQEEIIKRDTGGTPSAEQTGVGAGMNNQSDFETKLLLVITIPTPVICIALYSWQRVSPEAIRITKKADGRKTACRTPRQALGHFLCFPWPSSGGGGRVGKGETVDPLGRLPRASRLEIWTLDLQAGNKDLGSRPGAQVLVCGTIPACNTPVGMVAWAVYSSWHFLQGHIPDDGDPSALSASVWKVDGWIWMGGYWEPGPKVGAGVSVVGRSLGKIWSKRDLCKSNLISLLTHRILSDSLPQVLTCSWQKLLNGWVFLLFFTCPVRMGAGWWWECTLGHQEFKEAVKGTLENLYKS